MVVTCPNCRARYAVDPQKIGPKGRTVQCARCSHRWTETADVPVPPVAPPAPPPPPVPTPAAATTSAVPAPEKSAHKPAPVPAAKPVPATAGAAAVERKPESKPQPAVAPPAKSVPASASSAPAPESDDKPRPVIEPPAPAPTPASTPASASQTPSKAPAWTEAMAAPTPAPEPAAEPVPEMVIRPTTPGASLPAVVPPKVRFTKKRIAIAAVVTLAVVGGLVFALRDRIAGIFSSPPSQAATAAAPAAPAAATTAAASTPKPRFEVDLTVSKIEVVEGRYVVRGEVVNKGTAAGSTSLLKVAFKRNTEIVGERSFPLVEGPIQPGARASFSQVLDTPPAGATDLVPTVE